MVEIPGLKISGPLGTGGTAYVAKAFSEKLNREVAVKYPLDSGNESTQQFENLAAREIKLVAQLKYPGIVRILDFSEEPPYLVLELCHGQTLDQIGKIENTNTLLNVLSAASASLEFIRINSLVHGDIKPHNIFLPSDKMTRESNKLFFVKISDFSLGRRTDESESDRAGHGTIGYAAPETLAKRITTHKSDLFALGIIAYQLATGKHPFMEGESDPVKIESRIQEDEPESIKTLRNNLPNEFVELVNSLLAKKDSDRPESSWEVCQQLRNAGATYPFEQALSPHFLLKSKSEYGNFCDNFLELSDKERCRLDTLTDSKTDYLRIVLSLNFRKGNLEYSGKNYRFKSRIYWPSRLRRECLRWFTSSEIGGKRQLIRAAVVGGKNKLIESSSEYGFPPASSELFHHLISNKTVKRFSGQLVSNYESQKDFYTSAVLYLQVGSIEDATRCAEKAATNLTDAAHRASAINLVNRIYDYASMQGKAFDVRQLLMIKGDIELAGGDTDSAFDTYNRIIDLYNGKDNDRLLAETFLDLGSLYKSMQNFDAGINILNKAMAIYRESNSELEISRTLKELGNIHWVASKLPESLDFYRQALAIQKRLMAVADAATSLHNIASIYGMQGRIGRSIHILKLALVMKRKVGNEIEISRTLNNLGYAFQLNDNLSEAVRCLGESLDINRRLGSKRDLLFNLWNLSEVTYKAGRLKDSLEYVKEGLELSDVLNDKPLLGRNHLSFGRILNRMGRYSDAQSHFETVEKMLKNFDDDVLALNLKINQARIRYEIGDTPESLVFAQEALQMATILKAKPEVLDGLLILIIINGKKEDLELARKTAGELDLFREKRIVESFYQQYLLEHSPDEVSYDFFNEIEPKLNEISDDIELPRLLTVASEITFVHQDIAKSELLISKAIEMSRKMGLAYEHVCALIFLGRIQYEMADYEKCFATFKQALLLCKEVASNMNSNNDKQLFMSKPRIKFLATAIVKLSEKLESKKKASV